MLSTMCTLDKHDVDFVHTTIYQYTFENVYFPDVYTSDNVQKVPVPQEFLKISQGISWWNAAKGAPLERERMPNSYRNFWYTKTNLFSSLSVAI